MRRVKSVFWCGMLAGLTGLVCFAVGGRLGFVNGYLLASQTSSILTAGMVVASLHATAEGDEKSARGLLDLIIDSGLVAEWTRLHVGSKPPFYVPAEYSLNLEPEVRELAQYRKSHPQEHPDSLVGEVVARHASAADSE